MPARSANSPQPFCMDALPEKLSGNQEHTLEQGDLVALNYVSSSNVIVQFGPLFVFLHEPTLLVFKRAQSLEFELRVGGIARIEVACLHEDVKMDQQNKSYQQGIWFPHLIFPEFSRQSLTCLSEPSDIETLASMANDVMTCPGR
jgi:hypothetical protein